MLTFQPLRDTKKERTVGKLGNLFKDESGAAAVEQGLLLALNAMVIITTTATLGITLSALFQMVATSVAAL
jgi:Flp pilus assembly pilin Flp